MFHNVEERMVIDQGSGFLKIWGKIGRCNFVGLDILGLNLSRP